MPSDIRLRVERPLALCAAGVFCGAGLGRLLKGDVPLGLVILLGAVCLVLVTMLFGRFKRTAFFCAFAAAAGLYYAACVPQWQHLSEESAQVRGAVVWASEDYAADLRVRLTQLSVNGEAIEGDANLYVKKAGVVYAPGTVLSFTAEPITPREAAYFGAYSEKDALNADGVRISLFCEADAVSQTPGKASFAGVRSAVMGIFDRCLNRRSAALVSALILGDRRGMESSLYDAFIKLGAGHIFAVSGLHVGILAMLLSALFLRRAKGAARLALMLFAFAALVFYSMLSGSGSAVVRAVIMWAVGAYAMLSGREYDPLSALSLALIILYLISPAVLYSAGTIMSFSAVLCLICMMPYMRVTGLPKGIAYCWGIISASLCVFVGTLPLSCAVFGMVSPFGILYAVLLIPYAAFNIIYGIGIVVLSVVPPVALWAGSILNAINDCAFAFVKGAAELTPVMYAPGLGMPFALGTLALTLLLHKGMFRVSRRVRAAVLLCMLIAAEACISPLSADLIYGKGTILLREGKSLSAVARTDGGTYALINADDSEFAAYARRACGGRLDTVAYIYKDKPQSAWLNNLSGIEVGRICVDETELNGIFAQKARERGYTIVPYGEQYGILRTAGQQTGVKYIMDSAAYSRDVGALQSARERTLVYLGSKSAWKAFDTQGKSVYIAFEDPCGQRVDTSLVISGAGAGRK